MFSKTLVALFSAAALVAAAPTSNAGQCSGGTVQCCNSVQKAGAPQAAALLGLLGIVGQGVNVPIGITCSAVNVIGADATSCQNNQVCCDKVEQNGLVAINCVPVNAAA